MAKVNKSITLDEGIAKGGEKQAAKERRSFSSFIEYLIHSYLSKAKKTEERSE